MIKKIMFFIILTLYLVAEEKLEPRFNLKSGISYTSYVIDVTSSNLNRAINYRVLESKLGLSYSWEKGSIGLYSQFLLDSYKSSNMTLYTRDTPLNDIASINRENFYFYTNYKFSKYFLINLIYRYNQLESNYLYNSGDYSYKPHFNYKTNGLGVSLQYNIPISTDTIKLKAYQKASLGLSVGLLYSKANVNIFEELNSVNYDMFINDTSNALGVKLSVGYNLTWDNITFQVFGDWYQYNFDKLSIKSNKIKTNIHEQASLKENTYSIGFKINYRPRFY